MLPNCWNGCKLTPHARSFASATSLSLDATVIELCASMFDWARFRATKGALKLHLLLDHDGCLPVYACIGEGREADVQVAWQLELPKGSIVVVDRGYVDYQLLIG